VNPKKLLDLLKEKGINFYTGVPDSLLKDFCKTVETTIEKDCHLITPNEGTAVAIAIGKHLATGELPLVYMQNSGLGNAFNPLASLAHKDVYRVPILLMVGWRGEPGTSDEPQHMVQGNVTRELFELLAIPYLTVNANTELSEIETFINQIELSKSGPHALLVTAGTFEKHVEETDAESDGSLTRLSAIKILAANLPSESIVVATTGKLSRELNEIRNENDQEAKDFLVVGGMGHASGIALGVAIARPERLVVCLDGDGALQMHLGALALIGEKQPSNFLHFIFNNGTHESVGGQAVAAPNLNYKNLAETVGYKFAEVADNSGALLLLLELSEKIQGPKLIEVIISSSSSNDLSRPKNSPIANKAKFKEHVQLR
jgi:phosphonopyruvate decarboxylase